MTEAHVFLDANIALHYKRPDQIDWLKRAEADRVYLVATPIFLTELEKNKIYNTSRKVRQRAADYILYLDPYIDAPELDVRANVRWRFVAAEPQIRFGENNLSEGIADDRLIAHVLEYDPGSGNKIFVATADSGLRMKLKARGVEVLRPRAEDALPLEPDPLEQENRKLKEQVARHETRTPHLFLTGLESQKFVSITIPPFRIDSPPRSLHEVKQQHTPIKKTPNRNSSSNSPLGDLEKIPQGIQSQLVSPYRIDKYNENLDKFYKEYERFLDEYESWEGRLRATGEVVVMLANQGTAEARHIDIELTFPKDVVLFQQESLPRKPKEPTPPKHPMSGIYLTSPWDQLILTDPYLFRHRETAVTSADGVPIIKDDTNKVRIYVGQLKHHHELTFEAIYMKFPDEQSVRSFSVEYWLTASELPQREEGRINMVVGASGDA